MKNTALMSLVLSLIASAAVQAAELSFSRLDYRVSPEAAADGAPENGHIADFFVTTDADIISINQILVDVSGGELFDVECRPFQVCNGFPIPFPSFIPLNPAVTADSGINTPGDTVQLGADLPGDGTTLFGDLSRDGAQSDFLFARMTIPEGATGNFSGRITLSGAMEPERFPFSFALGIPEPTSLLLASMGMLSVVGWRRW